MNRSRRRRSPAALAGSALFLVAAAAGLAACGSDGATIDASPRAGGGSFAPSPEGCVTVPTTVPGMQFCQGYDPLADLAQQSGVPAAPTCPVAPVARPAGGWLGDTGTGPYHDAMGPRTLDDTSGAQALGAAAVTQLGAGFAVSETSAYDRPACPDEPPTVSATLSAPGGGTVYVVAYRLNGPLLWMEEPVSGDLVRATLDDGTEVVVNDFGGEGVYRRAWVARPDGAYVKVVAAGANAPSQGGWPTLPPTTAPLPTGGPAPLTLGEVQALALALLP